MTKNITNRKKNEGPPPLPDVQSQIFCNNKFLTWTLLYIAAMLVIWYFCLYPKVLKHKIEYRIKDLQMPEPHTEQH